MGRPLRLLAVLAMGVALATATSVAAIAAQPTPPTAEDQHDRRLRNLRAEQAERTQTAVNLFRSGERIFVPAPDSSADVAAPSVVRPVPAVPRPGAGVVVSLLLGLVGGVVGGCAVLAGWTAATRRRLRQPAPVT
jgi:septal ring-binding cell division protein DamX